MNNRDHILKVSQGKKLLAAQDGVAPGLHTLTIHTVLDQFVILLKEHVSEKNFNLLCSQGGVHKGYPIFG